MVKGDLRGITVQTVVDAARSGDEVSRRALEETGMYLGIGFANLVNTFNPSLVALGGMLSLGHEFLIPIARKVVLERAMKGPREGTQIIVSAFKADACMMGGVALVLHDILSRPHLGPFPLARRNAVPAVEEPSQPAGDRLTAIHTEGGVIST
jgi:predicted NBD/HSP70 family sugar kinase